MENHAFLKILRVRYASGKSRISSQISNVITERERESKTVVSLFCGTCSVESKLAKVFDVVICNDKQKYLIAMLNGVQNGYELPEFISEDQYKYIKEHKDEDKVLTGFVGFGCSFAGKFFGGYARNKEQTNYALQSKKSLLKDITNLKNTKFISKDYHDVELPDGCVVYCDPPYRGTTAGYGLKEKFDSDEFWEYMRKICKSHHVYISEQHAPKDFVSIWEKPFVRMMDSNKDNIFKSTEKLFVHKDTYKNFFK